MRNEGTIIPISCVRYGGVLPEWSGLKKNLHVSMKDVITELYREVCRIRTAISTESLGRQCVQYNKIGGSILHVSEVLSKLKNKICGS